MKATELIGKLAIRTKPVFLGFEGLRENCDYSYTTTPIRILKVTDNHIIYNHVGTSEEKIFGKKKHILNLRWLDNNWTDYNKLMKLDSKKENKKKQKEQNI